MDHLGHTRSAHHRDHRLQTPETFVRAALPGMRNATAIVHASPECGARFVQYSAELASDGYLAPCDDQRFVYVVHGDVAIGNRSLGAGDYCYLAPGDPFGVSSAHDARAIVIEKPYRPLPGTQAPTTFGGREDAVSVTSLGNDPWVEVRSLIPDDAAFDMRVNTMTYRPGASLPAVEVHVMEHGLMMLEGGGIYRLGSEWYSVSAGDFIWMGPYCPQWFGAIGKTPAKYLIYKDWDRYPR